MTQIIYKVNIAQAQQLQLQNITHQALFLCKNAGIGPFSIAAIFIAWVEMAEGMQSLSPTVTKCWDVYK